MTRTKAAALLMALVFAAPGCGETTRDADRRDIVVTSAGAAGTGSGGLASGGTGGGSTSGGTGGTGGGGAGGGGTGGGGAGGGGTGGGGALGGSAGADGGGAGGGDGGGAGQGGAGAIECLPREDDPTGYLVAICEYLVEHDDTIFTGVDPNSYNIESVEPGTEAGRDVLYVWLDCCFMGDYATIDADTGEVIGFSPGDV